MKILSKLSVKAMVWNMEKMIKIIPWKCDLLLYRRRKNKKLKKFCVI